MPLVDYEELHRYFTDEFDMPYDSKTNVVFYSTPKKSVGIAGFHMPFTRGAFVDAPRSERVLSRHGGAMRVLGHEMKHRADSHRTKLRTAGEIGLRWVS